MTIAIKFDDSTGRITNRYFDNAPDSSWIEVVDSDFPEPNPRLMRLMTSITTGQRVILLFSTRLLTYLTHCNFTLTTIEIEIAII